MSQSLIRGPANFVALACAYFQLCRDISGIPLYYRQNFPDPLSVPPVAVQSMDRELVPENDSAGHIWWLTIPDRSGLRPLQVKMLAEGTDRDCEPTTLLEQGERLQYGRISRDGLIQCWNLLELEEYSAWLQKEVDRMLPLRESVRTQPQPVTSQPGTPMSINRIFIFDAENGRITRTAEGCGDFPQDMVNAGAGTSKIEYPISERQIMAYLDLITDDMPADEVAGFYPGEDTPFGRLGVHEGVPAHDVWKDANVEATFTFDAHTLANTFHDAL